MPNFLPVFWRYFCLRMIEMKFRVLLALSLCLAPTLSQAVTDWTPYLKPMQQGCSFSNPTKNLPAVYKASVVKKSVKGNPKNEHEDVTTTFLLKNAVAFGLPIKAVAYRQGYEDAGIKVFFSSASFTKLRPLFKAPILKPSPDMPNPTLDENDSKGYLDTSGGYTRLEFDKKSQSITCSSGS